MIDTPMIDDFLKGGKGSGQKGHTTAGKEGKLKKLSDMADDLKAQRRKLEVSFDDRKVGTPLSTSEKLKMTDIENLRNAEHKITNKILELRNSK